MFGRGLRKKNHLKYTYVYVQEKMLTETGANIGAKQIGLEREIV